MTDFSYMGVDRFPYNPAEHEARIMCADPIALAFQWMTEYAKNLTEQCADEEYGNYKVSVRELIQTADSHQPESRARWGGDYITRGGAFEGMSVDPTFWKMYGTFRQVSSEDVEKAHFFSCSC